MAYVHGIENLQQQKTEDNLGHYKSASHHYCLQQTTGKSGGKAKLTHLQFTYFYYFLWGHRWHSVVVQACSLYHFRRQLLLYFYVMEKRIHSLQLLSPCLH